MRTAGVKQLVGQVLASIPKPHTEDVIDDVFHAIENEPDWLRTYDELCTDLGKTVVNTWGGYWVAHFEGRAGLQPAPSKKSTLVRSYSRLTVAVPKAKAPKKRKQPEALQMMSDYYHAHLGELPSRVRNHRQLLVELLMEGLSPEEVFAMVVADGH